MIHEQRKQVKRKKEKNKKNKQQRRGGTKYSKPHQKIELQSDDDWRCCWWWSWWDDQGRKKGGVRRMAWCCGWRGWRWWCDGGDEEVEGVRRGWRRWRTAVVNMMGLRGFLLVPWPFDDDQEGWWRRLKAWEDGGNEMKRGVGVTFFMAAVGCGFY